MNAPSEPTAQHTVAMNAEDQKRYDDAKVELFAIWFDHNQVTGQLQRARARGARIGIIEELEARKAELLEKYMKLERFLRD